MPQSSSDATGDLEPTGGLTRITFNATVRSSRAIEALMAESGDNKTDAINAALRLGATLLAFVRPDGTLHVLDSGGTTHIVHLP